MLYLEHTIELVMGKNLQILPVMFKLDEFITAYSKHPDHVFILTGFDRPSAEDYIKVDEYLTNINSTATVILLYEDLVEPIVFPVLNKVIPVSFNYDLMTNIGAMLDDNLSDFMPEHTEMTWLSLNRVLYPIRQYAITHWLETGLNVFYTSGEDKFIGHYNIYAGSNPPDVQNLINFKSLKDIYNRYCGSILFESQPADITEKTFSAIAALHPFLIVGKTPGLIKYLRDQGFDVFDDYFNHSYDELPEYSDRIDQLFILNKKIIETGINRHAISSRLYKNRNNIKNYFNAELAKLSAELIKIKQQHE